MTPREILEKYRVVAVVGASRSLEKDAGKVPAYLKEKGYEIIPINPRADEILGVKAYPSLLDLPEDLAKRIEIVDVFRPPQEAMEVVRQAAELKEKYGRPFVIWFQIGTATVEAVKEARKHGFEVVSGKCMMMEHKKYFGEG